MLNPAMLATARDTSYDTESATLSLTYASAAPRLLLPTTLRAARRPRRRLRFARGVPAPVLCVKITVLLVKIAQPGAERWTGGLGAKGGSVRALTPASELYLLQVVLSL